MTTARGLAVAVLGLVFGVIAYRVQVDDPRSSVDHAVMQVAIGWAFLVAGLAAWSRRPGNRLGPLMLATGFALLARQFRYSYDALAFTSFYLVGELPYAMFGHVALAYPTGRVTDRLECAFVRVAYATVLVFPLATLLFYDGRERLLWFDPVPRDNLLLVHGAPGAVDLLQQGFTLVAFGGLASVFVLLVFRKLVRATPRGRQILAPLLIAAVAAALRAVLECLLTFTSPPPALVAENLFWWQAAALLALPLALLAGLLRSRLAQAGVGELLLRLDEAPPAAIRGELARVLGDPSLEVAFWLPERREFVDAVGRPVTVPRDTNGRAVTMLEHEGEPLAAFVYDAGLRDEPELVDAAAAAARMALENARLHAEVHAQLDEVKSSRARIAAAADDERRRIERDLHDGAQQRLVALALELRTAQGRLGREATGDVEQVLDAAVEELQAAVSELRELARGIHPAILTEGGLPAALESLAAKSPVPATVEASVDGRPPPNVEATAYFVASEALANVAKHACASRVVVKASTDGERLVLAVVDDGVGGADAAAGTGLRGLADRVEAHGGQLRVESAPGGGTKVVAEIPCAS